MNIQSILQEAAAGMLLTESGIRMPAGSRAALISCH